MAAFMGRDVAKLKAKGGGKWKYMSEKEMLDISAKFSPYRSVGVHDVRVPGVWLTGWHQKSVYVVYVAD